MQMPFSNYVGNITINNQSSKIEELLKGDKVSIETLFQEETLINEFREGKEYLIK